MISGVLSLKYVGIVQSFHTVTHTIVTVSSRAHARAHMRASYTCRSHLYVKQSSRLDERRRLRALRPRSVCVYVCVCVCVCVRCVVPITF